MGIHKEVVEPAAVDDYIGIDGKTKELHHLSGLTKKSKKRASKKTKKGWRKFTNVKDVEDYLEEKRKESIQLGDIVENIQDDSLFFVDTHPNSKESIVSNNVSLGTRSKTHKEVLKGNKGIVRW
jgi:hypothetical protein